MTPDADHSEALCEAVRAAFEAGESLRISGAGSKAFLIGGAPLGGAEPGEGPAESRLLSVAEHSGILEHRPEELVITARAGTPLREVERALAVADQFLPFEPPRLHGGGTLGGAVACGLAGPGRPWRGGVRDALLGVEMINGRGERLRFGGQVMKNVAGYDVTRLQAGAFGTLGVLLAVSLKVLPRPAVETTRVFALDPADALARCRDWARRPYPITATCHWDGCLRVRLSGAEPAVAEGARALGGDEDTDAAFWSALRDHRLEAQTAEGWWRCSLPPAAREPLEGCLVSWAGAERWWRPDDGEAAPALLARHGGHGRPFDATFGIRIGAHLSPAERQVAARLKQAFDPSGILNPELSGEPASRAEGEHVDAD